MTFGERLYALRTSKNVSQEELAELLDVSRQSISKWENGRAFPEMTRLLFMSDYFGVSLDHLMRGKEADETTDAESHCKTGDMLAVWNSFVSNLTEKQRKWLTILCILAACGLLAAVASFVYGAGYAAGKLIGHITG